MGTHLLSLVVVPILNLLHAAYQDKLLSLLVVQEQAALLAAAAAVAIPSPLVTRLTGRRRGHGGGEGGVGHEPAGTRGRS